LATKGPDKKSHEAYFIIESSPITEAGGFFIRGYATPPSAERRLIPKGIRLATDELNLKILRLW